MNADFPISKQKQIDQVFSKIAGISDSKTRIAIPGTGIAQPGDLLFFTTHFPYKSLKTELKSKHLSVALRILLRSLFFKKYCGIDRNDFDEWHVGIYCMGRKRKRHERINLWIIHSHPSGVKGEGGVHLQHLSPNILFKKSIASKTRIEILQFKGINSEERKKIVDFAFSKVGFKFDFKVIKNSRLTNLFGLPNLLHDKNSYSCQQLVISAYASAGIFFPHPSASFPFFNIGKWLGHPLGHSKSFVNPKYPYLMDHHIYRDPRFDLKASIFHDDRTGAIVLNTRDIFKYSWNERLRNIYVSKKLLFP